MFEQNGTKLVNKILKAQLRTASITFLWYYVEQIAAVSILKEWYLKDYQCSYYEAKIESRQQDLKSWLKKQKPRDSRGPVPTLLRISLIVGCAPPPHPSTALTPGFERSRR